MIATHRALVIGFALTVSSVEHSPLGGARVDEQSATSLLALQVSDSARLVISEIVFNPVEGASAFVELLHVGQRPVDLTAFVLQIDTVTLPLPRLATPLAPNSRVLIRFDGGGNIEGNEVHAPPGFELRADGGTVSIRENDDHVLDEIAWGDALDAFVPKIGGLAMRGVERGSSFGRPPSANRAGARSDWVVYAPDAVTPGQPNPLPPVAQLMPVHGAVLEGTSTELMWYPVRGAVRYRVQLARDTTFAQTLLNQTTTDSKISTGQLQAGEYWWRVQAMQADGATAPWSRPSLIALGDGSDGGPAGDDGPITGAVTNVPKLLPVPLIMQHKDTKMLHLESMQEGRQRTMGLDPRAPHTWDRDHGTLDRDDPADDSNCALASLAMINRFYGGNLSQDRMGYEGWGPNVAKHRATLFSSPVVATLIGKMDPKEFREGKPGPERDMNYGDGLPWERLMAVALYAMGTLPGENSGDSRPRGTLTTKDLWDAVKDEIDAGHPVFSYVPGHAIVIRGYEVKADGRRFVHINDPWQGRYKMNIDLAASGPRATSLDGIWVFPNAKPQNQEPELTKDTDSDGVVDFDETERFKTNPANRDSDNDGVPDKQDIASGVYEIDPMVGYAYNPTSQKGRDYDFDGKPTELDPDSDNGGCKDGDEDINGDGERGGSETGNFNQTDDVCGDLQGSVSYLIEAINTDTIQPARVIHDQGVILVKLKPESPGSTKYVDAGSTYSYQGYARTEINLGNCILWGREMSRGAAPFSRGGEIGANRGDDGALVLGATADVAAATSTGGCSAAARAPGERTMNFPDCEGKLTPGAPGPPGSLVYRFNCTTKPDLGPGWTVIRFFARGFVRVT